MTPPANLDVCGEVGSRPFSELLEQCVRRYHPVTTALAGAACGAGILIIILAHLYELHPVLLAAGVLLTTTGGATAIVTLTETVDDTHEARIRVARDLTCYLRSAGLRVRDLQGWQISELLNNGVVTVRARSGKRLVAVSIRASQNPDDIHPNITATVLRRRPSNRIAPEAAATRTRH